MKCYSSGGVQDAGGNFLKEVPHTPQELLKFVKFMIDASFDCIFVTIVPEEPALLIPEIAKTPSRGPLSPLYGKKGSVLWGGGEL